MLWYKGWVETRFRLLFLVGWVIVTLVLLHLVPATAPTLGRRSPVIGFFLYSNPMLIVLICAMLAGGGIATQPSLQAAKGLHGSMLFTLTLPVTRFRLLLVRATIGWLEGVGLITAYCIGMWVISPTVQGMANGTVVAQYAATLIACGSPLYFLSVLLACALDDLWRVMGTGVASAVIWALPELTGAPAFIDIFRAMSADSPIFQHSMPLASILFSLGVSLILLIVAKRVVEIREY